MQTYNNHTREELLNVISKKDELIAAIREDNTFLRDKIIKYWEDKIGIPTDKKNVKKQTPKVIQFTPPHLQIKVQ